MDTLAVTQKSILERIKIFSGLIFLSLILLVLAYYLVIIHEENNRIKTKMKEQNAASITILDDKINSSFLIRNDIEEIIIKQGDPVLKDQVMDKLYELGNELVEARKKITEIDSNYKKSDSISVNHDFSIINIAYAQDDVKQINNQKGFTLIYALGIITLILVFSFIVMLKSKDERLISFSIDIVKFILGCFAGIITGAGLK